MLVAVYQSLIRSTGCLAAAGIRAAVLRQLMAIRALAAISPRILELCSRVHLVLRPIRFRDCFALFRHRRFFNMRGIPADRSASR